MDSLLNGMNEFAVGLSHSWWVCAVVLGFAAFDALIPMVPSESVVVALAAIGSTTGSPNLWLLALAAGTGAWIGDNTTFRLGALIGLDRYAWMRRPRLQRAFAATRTELDRRAALLVLTARYVPVGRVAVNLTAGASGFPRRRFLPLSAVAAGIWAAYNVLVGLVAGQWVEDNPMLGAAVAVSAAVVVGLLLDRGLQKWRARTTV